MKSFYSTARLFLFSLLIMGFNASMTFAQSITPDITVALDGSGDFTAIQAAIDAVPDNKETQTIILIKRGIYDQEKILVPASKTNVLLVGESRQATIISYHLFECLSGGFEGRCPAEDAMLWSATNIQTAATLTVAATGFIAENLTIQNTAGPVGQAQAVTVLADRVIFRNCTLTGYQDTLYLKSDGNRTYFEKCLIVGRTDYIYGGGTTFFQACEIRSWGGGWITAPATGLNATHGYVFNECTLTYALNSPRAGDDGRTLGLGRPWKNYPKVAWLYCTMTEKIDPLGWPTKWRMDYSDTSPELHLYEYQNTGVGADISGRSNWVGIRALTDAEAANYTLQAVLSGNDNWDPTAAISAIRTFNWTGMGGNADWLTVENWDLGILPDTGETAIVNGLPIVEATGGHFPADLSLTNGATLLVTAPSSVTFLAMSDATLSGRDGATLSGRIRTRDSIRIHTEDQFEVATHFLGVHQIKKIGAGTINLSNNNSDFTGFWTIEKGEIIAAVSNALGQARRMTVAPAGKLTISDTTAFYPETPLYVQQGAQLALNVDVRLSEFYIDGIIQPVGEYDALTHPDLITGVGKIKIERPAVFTFSGLVDGTWDNPNNFKPTILPQAGETVLTTKAIETTDFIFPANITFQPGGSLYLQGDHIATGTLAFKNATTIRYATNEAGFSLHAPLKIEGAVLLSLNSSVQLRHTMNLSGTISGNGQISISNDGTETENTGIVKIAGSNKNFEGSWNLTQPSGQSNSKVVLNAAGPFALGASEIAISHQNLLQLSHPIAAGEILRINLKEEARIQLDTAVMVKAALINGRPLQLGMYDSTTHPEFFIGTGDITIGQFTTSTNDLAVSKYVEVRRNELFLKDSNVGIAMYNMSGHLMLTKQIGNTIDFSHLPIGLYVVQVSINGRKGGIIVPRY